MEWKRWEERARPDPLGPGAHQRRLRDRPRIDKLLFEGTMAAERGALPVGREPGIGLRLKPGPAAAHRVA